MFEKKTCDRCGKQYSMRTISENRGKHLCRDCIKTCSICGDKLPMSHWFGQSYRADDFAQSLERQNKPWIGSGICLKCYNNKIEQEEKERRLIRDAQLAKAKETLETPRVWNCSYCSTVNRGNFCSNCGVSRKKGC